MKKNIDYLLHTLLTLTVALLAGGCDDISENGFTVTEPGTLELKVSADEKEFGYEEAEGSLKIETNTRWKASTEAPWIKLLADEGAGNAELRFEVTRNMSTTSPREGVITVVSEVADVASQSVRVAQKYTSLLTDKSSLRFSQNGGSEPLLVTCSGEWEAFCDVDYVSVTPEKGFGSETQVEVRCEANNTISKRTPTVVFRHIEENGEESLAEVTIVQEEATFAISSVARTVSAINGSTTFGISTEVGWTISVDDSWCRVSETSGTGNASITVTVDDNDAPAERTAIITVRSTDDMAVRSLALTQSPAPADVQTTVVEVIYREYTSIMVGYACDPGTAIVAKGVVYCKSSEGISPTLDNSDKSEEVATDDGSSFRTRLYSLDNSTEYVARGYVTINYEGVTKTYYGPAAIFTTKADPTGDNNPAP